MCLVIGLSGCSFGGTLEAMQDVVTLDICSPRVSPVPIAGVGPLQTCTPTTTTTTCSAWIEIRLVGYRNSGRNGCNPFFLSC